MSAPGKDKRRCTDPLCSYSGNVGDSELFFILSCPSVVFNTMNFRLADGDRDVALALAYIFHFQQEVGNAFLVDDLEFAKWVDLPIKEWVDLVGKLGKLSFVRVTTSIYRREGRRRYAIDVDKLERKVHKITEGSFKLPRYFS